MATRNIEIDIGDSQNIEGNKICLSIPNIQSIKQYIAYGSVGASTVRGLGVKRVVAAARKALHKIDLTHYKESFPTLLNTDTEVIRLSLPDGAQHWGVARKVLNIFLRGSLYNTYLTKQYELSHLDAYYEIPLDSISAKGIRANTLEKPLPKWVGVKHVSREINQNFQRLANIIANEKSTLRVHLDAIFWGGR
jgi:hypothetical protein